MSRQSIIDGSQPLTALGAAMIAAEKKRMSNMTHTNSDHNEPKAFMTHSARGQLFVYLEPSLARQFPNGVRASLVHADGLLEVRLDNCVSTKCPHFGQPQERGAVRGLCQVVFQSKAVQGLSDLKMFRLAPVKSVRAHGHAVYVEVPQDTRPPILKGSILRAAQATEQAGSRSTEEPQEDVLVSREDLRAAVRTINQFKRGPEGDTLDLRVDGVDGTLRASLSEVIE